MPLDKITILKQIDDALALAKHKIARCKYSDLSDLPIDELNDVITTLTYTIEQLSSPKSAHRKQVEQHQYSLDHLHRAIKPLAGALMSLRRAYEQDYIRSFEELTRADMFADFLEMASHLLETGYKDAAAVIVGSVLEEHLRKLVTKHGTGISKPDGSPKKADTINSELCAAGVYLKADQKSVTAWLDLRNSAAHGKYTDYTKDQILIMLQGVRNFISRLPA